MLIDARPSTKDLWMNFALGAALGAIAFIIIFGTRVLNVTYVDWLIGPTDMSMFYINWSFFRNGEWMFPIGMSNQMTYPLPVSIVGADNIPLLAIIFKALNFILPEKFQYFGIWGFLVLMLQGGLASVCIRRYTSSKIICLIASAFFVLSPIMLFRTFVHPALSSHFLILAAICVWVYKPYIKELKTHIIFWCTISTFTILINPYLMLMNGVLLVGYLFYYYLENRKFLEIIKIFLSSAISASLAFFLVGGFMGKSAATGVVGQATMNINALFNPRIDDLFTWSRFLKSMPYVSVDQHDGFQYIGYGIILLMPVVLYIQLTKSSNLQLTLKVLRENIKSYYRYIAALCASMVLFLLALSPVMTYGDKILLSIPLPDTIEKILSVFRSSGRFFWPVYYFILLFILTRIIKNINSKRNLAIMLLFVLFVQISDFSIVLNNYNISDKNESKYSSPLVSEFWKDAARQYNHIVTIWFPAAGLLDFYVIGEYASSNKMTVNATYLARYPGEKMTEVTNSYIKDINKGNTDNDILFIMKDFVSLPEIDLDSINSNYNFFIVDGRYVFVKKNALTINNYAEIKPVYINKNEIELDGFLNGLAENNTNKILIISSVYKASSKIDKSITDAMKGIGLNTDLQGKNGDSYIAVVDLANRMAIYDQASVDALSLFIDKNGIMKANNKDISPKNISLESEIKTTTIKDDITVVSRGINAGNVSTIRINNIDFSLQRAGLNIVVYNADTRLVEGMANFVTDVTTKGTIYNFSYY